jgi:hypothetical protein
MLADEETAVEELDRIAWNPEVIGGKHVSAA